MRSDRDRQAGAEGPTGGSDASVDTGSKGGQALDRPPYPPSLDPPITHSLRLMHDQLAFAKRGFETRDVARAKIAGVGDIYALGHPEHMKRVLLTERETFRKSEDFRIAFGEGLLTVEGEEWRQQRDVLQPLFTRDSVTAYADGMVEQIRRRVDRWDDGDRIVLQDAFTDMTLDVLFATLLGRELAVDGDRRIRDAAEHLHDWFRPTSYLLPEWVPTPSRFQFRRAKRTIRAEAERLLAEAAGDAPTDPADADDLLSLLVGIRESGAAESATLDDERLRDQMVTMIFAGHDTTTTTLTFACWALANHPDVYDRFLAEVDQLDGPPTLDDVGELDVTDRIISETLRLFPPVYILPRETTTDVVFDGYRIPADEVINVHVRLIQRDERWFDDPDTFRPSRWDGDTESERHDFAYAPFGGGPRICIGREFALLEAKLALATIGRRYKLYWLGENEPDGEPPLSLQMTTRMAPGQEFLVAER